MERIQEYTRQRLQSLLPTKKGIFARQRTVGLQSKRDEKTGRMIMIPAEGTEKVITADLVLIAAGISGKQKYVTDAFQVAVNERTNVETAPDG